MTAAGPEGLAVSQARDTAALAREIVVISPGPPPPCTWGDDAWHRAVSRLARIERPLYKRLLAEERQRT